MATKDDRRQMMKRYLLISLAAIALLAMIGYPTAAWLLGSRVEAELDNQYKVLPGLLPFIKLSDRKYQRGIFTSSETDTATLNLPSVEPVQVVLHSRIRHGPLSGMFTFAAATIDSDLEVDNGFKQDVAEWTGNNKLLAIHTVIHIDGSGGESVVTFPDIAAPRMSLQGAALKIDFPRDLASYTLRGDISKLTVDFKNGGDLQLSGIHIEGDHKRIFDDEPLLFSGTDKLTVAQLDLSSGTQGIWSALPSSVLVKQLEIDQLITLDADEYVDYVSKAGVDVMKVGELDYGPVHFNTSLLHLHARTVANIYHAYLDTDAKNATPAQPDGSALTQFDQNLINHGAEFRLDRLSFTRPEGEAVLSANAKFKDATAADFTNAKALLAKFQASMDIKIPEELIPGLFKDKLSNPDQADERIKTGLATLAAQGYISLEQGNVKTRLEFHDGQAWFNGKQYVQPISNIISGNPLPQPFAVPPPAFGDMPELARRLNCTACHSLDRAAGGPAWIAIANRYKNATVYEESGRSYPLVDGLVMKVSRGGSGHWGNIPMPATDPAGYKQADIRELVNYILSLAKSDVNPFVPQDVAPQKDIVPPFQLGESLGTFLSDMKASGSTRAAIDPHSRSSNGEVTSVWFASSGVRLFFANDGAQNLQTVRFDWPYSGKVRGIGIGDSLFKVNDTLGSPIKPPWNFGGSNVYLFPGEGNQYVRFDVDNGMVKTIFMLNK